MKDNWISVKDELPPSGVDVLAQVEHIDGNRKFIEILIWYSNPKHWYKDNWDVEQTNDWKVTYWQYLPDTNRR